MSNPFLSKFNTPFNTIPFDKISVDDYLPAFEEGIKQGLLEIDAIVNNTETPNFTNNIEALEKVGPLLEIVSSTFSNLNLAETSKEMQALAKVISPKLSDYSNDIILNDALFKRVEVLSDSGVLDSRIFFIAAKLHPVSTMSAMTNTFLPSIATLISLVVNGCW